MLPRSDIEWLDASDTVAEAIAKAGATGHSWYPVCRGSLDDVVGVVNVAKLLALRATKDGPGAFRANRTLPENVWKKHIETWQELWRRKADDDEKTFLESLPKPAPENPEREWTMELLYHFVKKQCLEHEISAALLLPKGDFNRLKAGSDDFDHDLLGGWRAELLGAELVEWLKKGKKVKVEWEKGVCKLMM